MPHHCAHPDCVDSKPFTRQSSLIRHQRTKHACSAQAQCSICQSVFSRPDLLKRHRDEKHGSSHRACGTCGKSFRKDYLASHTKTCSERQKPSETVSLEPVIRMELLDDPTTTSLPAVTQHGGEVAKVSGLSGTLRLKPGSWQVLDPVNAASRIDNPTLFYSMPKEPPAPVRVTSRYLKTWYWPHQASTADVAVLSTLRKAMDEPGPRLSGAVKEKARQYLAGKVREAYDLVSTLDDAGKMRIVGQLRCAGFKAGRLDAWAHQRTFFTIAAACGSLNFAAFIIAVGFDLDREDRTETTPLRMAIQHDQVQMVLFLLARDVTVDQRATRDLIRPLSLALRAGSDRIVKRLLNHGANPNSALLHALDIGQPHLVRVVLRYNPNPNLYNGMPLVKALHAGNCEIIHDLLAAGARLPPIQLERLYTIISGDKRFADKIDQMIKNQLFGDNMPDNWYHRHPAAGGQLMLSHEAAAQLHAVELRWQYDDATGQV